MVPVFTGAGIFDPASKMGLNNYEKEDWGQTLATWGFGEGCYIVLPILGPSTVRDTFGSLANYMGADTWYNITVMILDMFLILIITPQ